MPELSRTLLLLIVAALVVNLVQGGPDQVKRWLSAKFLGRGGAPDLVAGSQVAAAGAAAGVAGGAHLKRQRGVR